MLKRAEEIIRPFCTRLAPLPSIAPLFGAVFVACALSRIKKVVPLSSLTSLVPLSPVALIFGGALVITAVAWFVFTEMRRNPKASGSSREVRLEQPNASRNWILALSLIIVVGAMLRLIGLDDKTITHPEIYIPGIPLPDGISEPPPRLEFWTALKWHYFSEPHPVGYYLAMFGWTKLFGITATALRMPSALLGILSLPVVFRLGALCYDRKTGLIAAGFLALHGFHIHTGQLARMFVPECFLGLIATWLLVEILRARRFRAALGVAYVIVLNAGFLTEWFFWPLIGAHLLFTLLHYRERTGTVARVLHLQILAMVLGGYSLSHAFTTMWLAGSGQMPSLTFLREFLSFGIVYFPDPWSRPLRAFPDWAVFGAFALALAFLVRGLNVRPTVTCVSDSLPLPSRRPLYLAAVGMTVVMAGLALLSLGNIRYLMPLAVFPATALALLPAVAGMGPKLRWIDGLQERRTVVAAFASPVAILALVPLFAIFVASFFRPMVDAQAMLVFTPYLLIVLAAGAPGSAKRSTSALVSAISSSFIHASGSRHLFSTIWTPLGSSARTTRQRLRNSQTRESGS